MSLLVKGNYTIRATQCARNPYSQTVKKYPERKKPHKHKAVGASLSWLLYERWREVEEKWRKNMFKNPSLDYSETEAIFNLIFLFFLHNFFSNSIPFYLDNGNIKL